MRSHLIIKRINSELVVTQIVSNCCHQVNGHLVVMLRETDNFMIPSLTISITSAMFRYFELRISLKTNNIAEVFL